MYNLENPYLSIVVVVRNDDYGGRLLDKIQVFINSIYELANKYRIYIEIIFVEWNPPEENKLLKECLIFPPSNYCFSRFILVPCELHEFLNKNPKIYLYEYLGKNVGIRRAKGEFILITNPDNLIGEGIFRKVSSMNLQHGIFYRAGRYNINQVIDPNLKYYKFYLEFAKKHIIDWRGYILYYSGNKWFIKYNPIKWVKDFWVNILSLIPKYYPYFPPALCTPGDFILMSKKDWFSVKGFLERIPYSYTCGDGVLIHWLLANNLKQIYWINNPFTKDACLYSQPQNNRKKEYTLSLEEQNIYFEILKIKSSFRWNDDDWGLRRYDLEEFILK